jgi:hypothetical protein
MLNDPPADPATCANAVHGLCVEKIFSGFAIHIPGKVVHNAIRHR